MKLFSMFKSLKLDTVVDLIVKDVRYEIFNNSLLFLYKYNAISFKANDCLRIKHVCFVFVLYMFKINRCIHVPNIYVQNKYVQNMYVLKDDCL